MAQLLDRAAVDRPNGRANRDRAVKILAKSIFKELRSNGYDPREIVALSTELISQVTSSMRPEADEETK